MALRPRLETLETREVPAAKLQLVNNSPDMAMQVVDIYIQNTLAYNDVKFQEATVFRDTASQENLKIDFVPATAANNSAPIASVTLNLPDNSMTTAVAVGQPGTTTFRLATASTRATAVNPALVEIISFNGAPDLPPADFQLRGIGKIADDLAFGKFSGSYQGITPANIVAQVTSANSTTPLAGATLDLADAKGRALIIMSSGFVTPAAGQPPLSIIGVSGDGRTITFTPRFDPLYAVGTATSKGSVALQASGNGTTTRSLTAVPNSTAPARVATADFTGDGVPDLIVGSGLGVIGIVRIFDGNDGTLLREFEPFGPFLGGVNVAAGEITGDGTPDYVVSPDDGGGPRVRIFNGKTNAQVADFFGIADATFFGGARTAIGDLNGDGRGDLLVAAGLGGGPRIAIFNGATLTSTGGTRFGGDFFAFEAELRNGAFLTAGDINGDGFDDLVVGGGPGGGPRVRAFDGKALSSTAGTQAILADFFAGDEAGRRGIRLTSQDVDGDGRDDIIVGGSPGASTVTRTYLAKNLPLGGSITPSFFTTSIDGLAPTDDVYVG